MVETIARTPFHLGSNAQPGPVGIGPGRESIGEGGRNTFRRRVAPAGRCPVDSRQLGRDSLRGCLGPAPAEVTLAAQTRCAHWRSFGRGAARTSRMTT
jgi:hypothetical protein